MFLVRKISGKDTGQVFAMKVLRKVISSLLVGSKEYYGIGECRQAGSNSNHF